MSGSARERHIYYVLPLLSQNIYNSIERHIKAKEPQLIAFNAYFNKDETEMTNIQVHPDAASMDFQMQVMAQVIGEDMIEWIERSNFFEPKHIEIYRTPSAKLLEADQPLVDAGIPRSVKPVHFAGFTRSTAG